MNFTPINVRIAFDISHARTSVFQTGSVTCIIGLSSMSIQQTHYELSRLTDVLVTCVVLGWIQKFITFNKTENLKINSLNLEMKKNLFDTLDITGCVLSKVIYQNKLLYQKPFINERRVFSESCLSSLLTAHNKL